MKTSHIGLALGPVYLAGEAEEGVVHAGDHDTLVPPGGEHTATALDWLVGTLLVSGIAVHRRHFGRSICSDHKI